jgi:hypothetical protein
MLFLRYVGTDPAVFEKSFDRMKIVDGTSIPRGKRGFMFAKFTYEEQLKLKTARRLDKIKAAREDRGATIAKDSELQRFVKENSSQVRELLLQLDAPKTALFREKLQKKLGSQEADVGKLLASFFQMDDASFNDRYKFFYDELGKDVKLSTLDGKARLAERAKPLLAQIPDGAFGDLMRQRLGEITGVGVLQPAALPEKPKPVSRLPAQAQKRSLVRGAISVLLQQPSLALSLEPPYGFKDLQQPGVALLVELLSLVHARPEITTGALLQHFAEREELTALQKLASQAMPGSEAHWRQELIDAAEQLEDQAIQQRLTELQAKMGAGPLDVADKYELMTLLQAQRRRGKQPA